MALEVHLPQLVGLGAFEAPKRTGTLGLALFKLALPAQYLRERAGRRTYDFAGDVGAAKCVVASRSGGSFISPAKIPVSESISD
jgi:hypothetical protein